MRYNKWFKHIAVYTIIVSLILISIGCSEATDNKPLSNQQPVNKNIEDDNKTLDMENEQQVNDNEENEQQIKNSIEETTETANKVVESNESGNINCDEDIDNTTNSINRKRGNSIGNIANNGYVAANDEWIIYAKPFGGGIYKIKKDGTKRIKLSDDYGYDLNVMDNWIYYINGDNRSIYRMKLDGSNKMQLVHEFSYWLNIYEGWIYYVNNSDNHSIYKMKLDGTAKTKLNNEKSSSLNVVGEWIYYIKYTKFLQSEYDYQPNGYIYKMRIDGSENIKLSDDKATYLNVQNNWIYYSNYNQGSHIFKIRIDGTEREELNNVTSFDLNVVDEWIYYTNMQNLGIYKLKTDGSKNIKIVEDNGRVSESNVIGNCIFYKFQGGSIKSYGLYKINLDGKNKEKLDN